MAFIVFGLIKIKHCPFNGTSLPSVKNNLALLDFPTGRLAAGPGRKCSTKQKINATYVSKFIPSRKNIFYI